MLLRSTNLNIRKFAAVVDILACVVIIPLILRIMPLAHVMEAYTMPILTVIGYVYVILCPIALPSASVASSALKMIFGVRNWIGSFCGCGKITQLHELHELHAHVIM